MKWAEAWILVPLLVLLVGPSRPAGAAPNLPQPSTHVADYAGVIKPDVASTLDGWLTELEQKTTAQVIVLTVKSLDGLPIEKFTIELMSRWKLGQKGKDNGVLICVSTGDRKYRIEVGYGLEGAMPDSWCGTIGRQYFVPNFRRGDYSTGIYEASVAIANRVAQEYGVSITGLAAPVHRLERRGQAGRALGVLVAIIIVSLVIASRSGRGGPGYRRRRGGFWEAMMIGSMLSGSSRRSSGWGGGSWGGGGGWGGGSFGGGGGGSFGGGGASGGW